MQSNIPHKEKAPSSRGYAILFTVLLVAIILSVSLGIANIALKELDFSSQAQGSNASFFASDSAGECTLYAIMNESLAQNLASNLNPPLDCDTQTILPVTSNINSAEYLYDDIPYANGSGCANVSVTINPPDNQGHTSVTVISDGYNVVCAAIDSPSAVNRELSYTIPL